MTAYRYTVTAGGKVGLRTEQREHEPTFPPELHPRAVPRERLTK